MSRFHRKDHFTRDAVRIVRLRAFDRIRLRSISWYACTHERIDVRWCGGKERVDPRYSEIER
jgi:hypothetical protein